MTASHLIAVPLVTLVLLFQDRRTIFASTRFEWIPGLALILAGIAVSLAIFAYHPSANRDDSLSIRIAGFVMLWLGGFLLFYGAAAFRSGLFALLFLIFMIPIPDAIIDAATLLLKRGSTEMVAWLLTVVRTPYYREGYVFAMPTLTIEVADACSGIRSTIALLLTVLLAGHMFLETSWRKALLVLAILPVTLFKNAVRIVALSLLAMHVDPGFIKGQLHHEGGIFFFLLGLAMLAPVLTVLRRSETPRPERPLRPVVQA